MAKDKITIVAIILLLIGFPIISAQDMTFEEFQKQVEEANGDGGFFSFLQAVTGGGNYWGLCEQTCANIIFGQQCNPCNSGDSASNVVVSGDSVSSYPGFNSGQSYCNYVLKHYDYFNVQAYCTTPSQECSGGADPGDEKCTSGNVYECSNNGAWELEERCDFDCSNGRCFGECGRDRDCGTDQTLDKFCKNGDIHQNVKKYDCFNSQCNSDTIDQFFESCLSDEICESGGCIKESKTCQELGKTCGLQDDGAGNQLNCGSCFATQDCIDGQCEQQQCISNCGAKQCGDDSCGNSCGSCDNDEQCSFGNCVSTNECNSNSDCLSSEICKSGFCQEKFSCDSNSDCSGDESCVSGLCLLEDDGETQGISIFTWIVIGLIIIFFIVIIVMIFVRRKK